MEIRGYHISVGAALFDKSAVLIQEPHHIHAYFAETHYQRIEWCRHSGVLFNGHIVDRLQVDIFFQFQHLHAQVGRVNDPHLDVLVRRLILNDAVNAVVTCSAIELNLSVAGKIVDGDIALEVPDGLDVE